MSWGKRKSTNMDGEILLIKVGIINKIGVIKETNSGETKEISNGRTKVIKDGEIKETNNGKTKEIKETKVGVIKVHGIIMEMHGEIICKAMNG